MEDKHKAIDILKKVNDLIINAKCSVRLKVIDDSEPERWGGGIGFPSINYLEIHGPYHINEIEWLDIGPIQIEHIGRLVKPRIIDHSASLATALKEMNLRYLVVDGMFRLFIKDIDE